MQWIKPQIKRLKRDYGIRYVGLAVVFVIVCCLVLKLLLNWLAFE